MLTCKLENVAWHAGTDNLTGRTPFWKRNNINGYSIGVELEGFAATGFTPAQIGACVKVGAYLSTKYRIPPQAMQDNLYGYHLHSEISNQRSDPGPLFPYADIMREIARRS